MITPILAAQINLVESILGFIAVVVFTFLLITWVMSFIRFQDILGLLNKEDVTESIASDSILQLQLAKFLSSSGREQIPFGLLKCSIPSGVSIEELEAVWKPAIRESDWIMPLDEQAMILLLRCDREDVEALWGRLCRLLPRVSSSAWQVGATSFPADGLSGRALLAGVNLALEVSIKEGSLQWAEEVKSEDEMDPETDPESDEESDESAGGHDKLLDPLTGVLRDRVLSTFMHRQLNEYRLKKEPVALFCVAVDNMEQIRSFHGEAAHDQLLAEISKVLQSSLRSTDMIGRYEEHGFLILVGCQSDHTEGIAERVCGTIQKKVCMFAGKRLRTTTTVGIGVHPEHGRNLHELYVKAQQVVDHCRENDIRGYAYYDEVLHRKQKQRPTQSMKATRK
jgi:diguanylate cyclase (GGDEF)-like protein